MMGYGLDHEISTAPTYSTLSDYFPGLKESSRVHLRVPFRVYL